MVEWRIFLKNMVDYNYPLPLIHMLGEIRKMVIYWEKAFYKNLSLFSLNTNEMDYIKDSF